MRYENRQLTSAQVVERLVALAKQVRDAGRRHEQLGLGEEEAAFYDALAGGAVHVTANAGLAAIAHELVESVRRDLTVDWSDRKATEAKIRTKIKRLLRRHKDALLAAVEPAPADGRGDEGGGRLIDRYADAVLDQAKALYRYWPDEGDRAFEQRYPT